LAANAQVDDALRFAEAGDMALRYPLVSLPGEELASYLKRSHQSADSGDTALIESSGRAE